MRLFRGGLTARPAFLLMLLFVLMVAGVSADTTTDNTASTTAATTAATTTDATSTDATTGTATTDTAATTTSLPSLSTSTSSDSSSGSSSTGTSTGTSKSSSGSGSSTDLPSLTSTTTAAGSTYSYPAPSVPPTENAPYMKKSKAPEGTFFIAVGSALGFIGLVILAWRGIVAWSVNRSVRKAAMMQARAEKIALLQGKGRRRRRSRRRSTVSSQVPGANMSMEKLGTTRRSSYVPPVPNPNTRTSGLFYSPTAGAGMHANSNRTSTYLPAGYYASSNAAPGGGSAMSFAGLGPQSQGYTRTGSAPSPPASPLLSPNRGHDPSYRVSQARMSNTSLNVPPQGRTPSTYLEDLFDHHAPGSDIEHK